MKQGRESLWGSEVDKSTIRADAQVSACSNPYSVDFPFVYTLKVWYLPKIISFNSFGIYMPSYKMMREWYIAHICQIDRCEVMKYIYIHL